MTLADQIAAIGSAAIRSSLAEFASERLQVVRSCLFSCPAKILTPADDILVPLLHEGALPDLLGRNGIAGVITTPELAGKVPGGMGLAITNEPLRAHHEIHVLLSKMPARLFVDFPSEIDPSAEIHPTAWIASRNVRIGAGARILPFAVVNEHSEVGEGSRIHSQAVIGGDAYEIVMIDGQQVLRPQTGGVVIGKNCEILTGSVVTRAAFWGATIVGDRTVLDCKVIVSHDCHIGTNVRIGGSSWLGGRVRIGDRASLGPNCSISNGLRIGEGAKVSIGAVVTRDVASHGHVSGNFAIDHHKLIEQLRRNR